MIVHCRSRVPAFSVGFYINILHKFCMFNFACLVLVVGSECLILYSRFCILIRSSVCVCVLSFG